MKKSIIIFTLFFTINLSAQETTFKSAGTRSQYVPVLFSNLSVAGSLFKTFNISRYNIHQDQNWLAYGSATITAVGFGWGSGGNGIRLDNFTYGKENPDNTGGVISFIGSVICDWANNNVIVYLRGDTTYRTDGIVLQNDGAFAGPAGNQNLYPVSILDPDFNIPKGSYFADFEIKNNNSTSLSILGSKNVGIGTTNPTEKLTVAGKIKSREVQVTVDAGADFVFEKDYNLPSLESIDKFIKENKHLPEIASAEEMKTDGINLSEMNIKLLQKIEEMTLYMIEQNKRIEKLEKNQK